MRLKNVEKCQRSTKLTSDDTDNFCSDKLLLTETGKCFYDCFMRQLNVVSTDEYD